MKTDHRRRCGASPFQGRLRLGAPDLLKYGGGRESNPPATVLAAKPVLKTGGATGPLPPPSVPILIRCARNYRPMEPRTWQSINDNKLFKPPVIEAVSTNQSAISITSDVSGPFKRCNATSTPAVANPSLPVCLDRPGCSRRFADPDPHNRCWSSKGHPWG